MTFEEFEHTAGRLRTVYGDRAFPTERLEIVYRAVRFVSMPVWNETLNELIGESMQPPNLTKIRDTLNVVRKRSGETSDAWEPIRKQIRELEMKSQCGKCFGSGIVMAHRGNDPHQYMFTFACNCESGNLAIQLPENYGKIRQWNASIAGEWRHNFDNSVRGGTRIEARKASVSAIRNSDLNSAIGIEASPRRPYKDDNWDSEL